MTLVVVTLLLSLVCVKAQLEGVTVNAQLEKRSILTETPLGRYVHGYRGIFKAAQLCPIHEHVIGYRAQVQKAGVVPDKVGLTGIQMKCSGGDVLGPVGIINSGLGTWSDWRVCPPKGTKKGVVTGFNLRYENVARIHHRTDYYGASQIKMQCSNGNVLGPDGPDMGKWAKENGKYAACSSSSKFCGFAAEVQDYQESRRGSKPNSGVNRIRFLCCITSTGKVEARPGWTPLGKDICIGTRNEKYGFLKMPVSGFLGSVKLVHREGEVRCSKDTRTTSNFGCHISKHHRDKFSMFVTASDNSVILPDKNNQKARDHLFYEVIGQSARDDKEFTLQADEPTFLTKGEELRIWYGEDLKNRHDWDNGDSEVCIDLYGKLLN